MTRFAPLLVVLGLFAAGLHAETYPIGEASSPDGSYRLVVRTLEQIAYAKKPTNFQFELSQGNTVLIEGSMSLTIFRRMDGFVCSTDTDVQAEKAGKCPKCQAELQPGQIRKKEKEGVNASIDKDGFKAKHVFEGIGNYEIEVKVQPTSGEAFTGLFYLYSNEYVAKPHHCLTCRKAYPGPGNCTKCGKPLTEGELPKPEKPKDTKKHH